MAKTDTVVTTTEADDLHKPPIYYVRKRLFKNKPAIAGLIIIIVSVVIATLGYLIMPDKTPNAHTQTVQVQLQSPGFSVKMLRKRIDRPVDEKGFFGLLFLGQEEHYDYIPIVGDYKLDEENLIVYATEFGGATQLKAFELVDLVEPLYAGISDKLEGDNNFKIEGDKITYLDFDEKEVVITKEDILNKFKEEGSFTKTYYLGTDSFGRDVLSRLILGVRISLGIGMVSVFISLLVGVFLGSVAGFFGGRVDDFIMWFMTVVWSIPGIMLVIAISLALNSRGVWTAFVAVGLTMWVEIARVIRGQILSVKEKTYIEAARALGIRSLRIIYVHILPNIFGPLIVISTSNFATAILMEAGLSFLGLGVQPPTPSWGGMVSEGRERMLEHFYLILLPSLCISIMVLAFNLFGNGLRDAYDPKG